MRLTSDERAVSMSVCIRPLYLYGCCCCYSSSLQLTCFDFLRRIRVIGLILIRRIRNTKREKERWRYLLCAAFLFLIVEKRIIDNSPNMTRRVFFFHIHFLDKSCTQTTTMMMITRLLRQWHIYLYIQ